MKYQIDVIPCKRKDTGKKLFLQRCSCPASDPAKNLLCLHGLTFTQHVFDINIKDYSIMRFFAREGYTVWAVDAGGHGRSERYENGFDVTTKSVSEDIFYTIETINETMGTKQVDLLGWSWGTNTTSMLACEHPELVRKLVLAGPVTGGTLPPLSKAAFPEDKTPLEYMFVARLFRHKFTASGAVSTTEDDDIDYDITEPEVVNLEIHNALRYDMSEPKPQGPNIDLYTAGDKWLIDGDTLKTPALIIKGTDDIYSTDERVDILMSKLPEGSEKCIIRGGGHGMFFEKDYHVKFKEAVLNFLEK